MFDTDPVEHFVQAARQIQRAAGTREIAVATAGAVPGSDATLCAALESCLTALELSLAQCAAASLEQAHDLRLNTRRQLSRLIGMHANPELAASLAEMAVQAVAGLTGSPAITRAAETASGPVAFSGLSGALFVSAQARQLAADHGLAQELETLLLAAALPIRNACSASGISAVGELRHRVTSGALTVSARLDRTSEGRPLIRIRLHTAELAPDEDPSSGTPPDYAARVLRRLVS